MQMDGKVVVVTGASMGIGEAIAKIFADNGAGVVFLARDVVHDSGKPSHNGMARRAKALPEWHRPACAAPGLSAPASPGRGEHSQAKCAGSLPDLRGTHFPCAAVREVSPRPVFHRAVSFVPLGRVPFSSVQSRPRWRSVHQCSTSCRPGTKKLIENVKTNHMCLTVFINSRYRRKLKPHSETYARARSSFRRTS